MNPISDGNGDLAVAVAVFVVVLPAPVARSSFLLGDMTREGLFQKLTLHYPARTKQTGAKR